MLQLDLVKVPNVANPSVVGSLVKITKS